MSPPHRWVGNQWLAAPSVVLPMTLGIFKGFTFLLDTFALNYLLSLGSQFHTTPSLAGEFFFQDHVEVKSTESGVTYSWVTLGNLLIHSALVS
jgi:hypothetical protein